MNQKKGRNSDPHENLANSFNKKKQKKFDKNPAKSLSHGNSVNSSKKRNKSNENTERSDSHGNIANPLKKKQKESDENSKKANLYNQITIREADMPQRFNLSRKQLQKKWALLPHRIRRGKRVVELSNNTRELMDTVDQAIGIFQEEIFMEILSWLPVKSLHRFKCVSKFWKALISDPYFKKKHLNRAKNDRNFQKFLSAKVCPDNGDLWSFYCSSLMSIPLVVDEQKLDFPSNLRPWRCTVLCSCDGLALLAVYDRIDDDRIDEHLLLWNPSTRESTLLPHPKPQLVHCVCGLQYDTTSDDYKILTIDLNGFNSYIISSEILALKSGTWRTRKYPTGIRRVTGPIESSMDSLAFLHGAFHWHGWKEKYGSYTIVTYNISNEVYGEIPFSEQICDMFTNTMLERGVSVLGGMLCTYASFDKRERAIGKLWIWVMKEYGVKESWTVLYTIQDANVLFWARPKYMYEDGEVLLHCRQKGASYIPIFRRSRRGFELWPSELRVKQGSVYTESLISPKLIT